MAVLTVSAALLFVLALCRGFFADCLTERNSRSGENDIQLRFAFYALLQYIKLHLAKGTDENLLRLLIALHGECLVAYLLLLHGSHNLLLVLLLCSVCCHYEHGQRIVRGFVADKGILVAKRIPGAGIRKLRCCNDISGNSFGQLFLAAGNRGEKSSETLHDASRRICRAHISRGFA